MEMVSSREINHVHISFMVAGHTKFAPDHLFSVIGSTYKKEDVFAIHKLQAILYQSATTFIEDGQQVLTWRDSLGDKYSDLPGVCKLHNFLVKTHNGNVVMREKGFTGDDEGFTTLCPSQHCGWFQPPSTVSATFTVFQLRKCPIWSPCMTISFLLIVVQIATTDCCIVYTTCRAGESS